MLYYIYEAFSNKNIIGITYAIQDLPVQLLEFMIFALVATNAFPFHGATQTWVARELGDKTAYDLGLMKLKHKRHRDIAGVFTLILTGLGWSNVTPVDVQNITKVPKKAARTMIFAIGPFANIVVSVIFLLFARLIVLSLGLSEDFIPDANSDILPLCGYYLALLFDEVAKLIINFTVFSLIPIPPLDGYNIFFGWLPESVHSFMYRHIQKFAFPVFFIFVFACIRNPDIFIYPFAEPLYKLSDMIYSGLSGLTELIYFNKLI